jgi:hypothetical protein
MAGVNDIPFAHEETLLKHFLDGRAKSGYNFDLLLRVWRLAGMTTERCSLIQINEVVKKSTQGVTRPFICRDDVGRQLWVKGAELTAPELAAEWICAQLALEWGLPLAPCSLVYIDPSLIEYSTMPEISTLGSGIGFGSFHVEGAMEMDFSHIQLVSTELAADILLFDYWVNNEDRTLGEHGGNPNLLFQLPEGNLIIIDHNLAFDREFSAKALFRGHVFGYLVSALDEDFIKKRKKKLLDILDKLPDILSSIPREWFEDDDLRKVSLAKDVERMECILRRIETDSQTFWEVLK